MPAVTVPGTAGSLRSASLNGLLVRATVDLAPSDMTVEMFGSLNRVPHYDADPDTANPPDR